jgi:hypothetical protein
LNHLVVDHHPLRVQVAGADHDATPRGDITCRIGAVVADDADLAEVGECVAGGDQVVHLDEHPFEALVEVEPVLGRIEVDAGRLDIAEAASSSMTVFGCESGRRCRSPSGDRQRVDGRDA